MNTNMAIDSLWVLVGGILVFWMQAGFAMVETGFTRSKNAGNIIMQNLINFAIASLIFWSVGFAIMYGADVAGIIGTSGYFPTGDGFAYSKGIRVTHFYFFKQFCEQLQQ